MATRKASLLATLPLILALTGGLLAACAGAPPAAPTSTPTARAATNTPAPTRTPFPTETPLPTATLPPTVTPTAGPTATVTPNAAALETLGQIKLIGLAWYDDYDLLLSFQFPGPVSAEDYTVTLQDKVYNCEVLTQYPDRLYCKGQGARVLAVAMVRVYPAGQPWAGFEKEMWVPYFSNNYSDVPQ